MTPMVLAVLAASLAGSLHCAGMCGGLLAFCTGADASVGRARAAVHVAYHGGRLVTYTLLGLLAGSLGAAVDLAGAAAGLQRAAMAVAGGVIALWGAAALAQSFGVQIPRLGLGARLWVRPLGWMGTLRTRPPVVRAGFVGLCSTLLPCGWLYAFAVTAAGTGSPTWGTLVMATFWVGTLPVMVGLGVGVQALAGRLRRHIPRLSAVALVLVGLLTLLGKAGPPPAGHRSAGARVEQPPCHHGAAERADPPPDPHPQHRLAPDHGPR